MQWKVAATALGHAKNEADALRKGRSEENRVSFFFKRGASGARDGDIDDRKVRRSDSPAGAEDDEMERYGTPAVGPEPETVGIEPRRHTHTADNSNSNTTINSRGENAGHAQRKYTFREMPVCTDLAVSR